MLLRRGIFAALLVALVLPAVAHAEGPSPCVGDPTVPQSLTLDPVDGYQVTGEYAFPATEPKGLVVFFHGYGHTAEQWADHSWLTEIAARDDVVTVAMNYHGTSDANTWQVDEGADDSIAAAQHFDQICGGFPAIVAYGVSMGGNASGLALVKHPTRWQSTAPLFDWWFDIEGANNVVETYDEARAVAPSGDKTAATAVVGIQNEMGGKTFEEDPENYLEHSNVYRSADIASSGIHGVVMVHGVADGLVPYNQSREMAATLRASGVPVQFWNVFTRDAESEPGTTLDGDLKPPGPYVSPFAGHANETSLTALVGRTGMDRLDAFFAEHPVQPSSDGEFVRDGQTGQYTKP